MLSFANILPVLFLATLEVFTPLDVFLGVDIFVMERTVRCFANEFPILMVSSSILSDVCGIDGFVCNDELCNFDSRCLAVWRELFDLMGEMLVLDCRIFFLSPRVEGHLLFFVLEEEGPGNRLVLALRREVVTVFLPLWLMMCSCMEVGLFIVFCC